MTIVGLRLKTPFVVDAPLELLCLLRHTRNQRDVLWTALLRIEEQRRAGRHDDPIIAEHHALNADLAILDELIKRMWSSTARQSDNGPVRKE